MSGSTRKHDSEVLQHSAQYVRAGGWSAMARVVRDFDEEKVKDCKEDIDTLLVFAGLFSAVLSAFLVGSYPLLQQDTPGQILLTLDKIYQAQIGGGPASSPAVSQPEPFVPSTSAVRVNVLWFSSLIISLTTASFGMLVKQWLREYLAVENPSPQARLRIRHFREPELTRWAVFEIAAVLPVLLQLSLGLFFIGLCYFTSMVHPSIGNTSLPLVAGWAFCFLTVTILPVFFPRCPYKTTLLKKALTTAHQGGATVVAKFFEGYYTRGPTFADVSRKVFDETVRAFVPKPLQLLRRHVAKSDERKAAVSEDADLDILAAVDAVQSNDELLETTIAESLDQASPEWPAAISFLSHVLRNRLGLHPPNVCFTDLGSLTKRGRDAVVNILLRYTSKISLLDRDWNSDERRAVSTAFSVLLAYSDSDGLSETGWSVMCECLTNGGKTLCRPFGKLFQSQPENSNFDYTDSLPSIFFSRLSAALTQLGLDLDVALTHLEAVANGYMEGHRTLENILADDDLQLTTAFSLFPPAFGALCVRITEDLGRAMTQYLYQAVFRSVKKSHIDGTSTSSRVRAALSGALWLSYVSPRNLHGDRDVVVSDIFNVFDQLLDTKESAALLMETVASVPASWMEVEDVGCALADLATRVTTTSWSAKLSNMEAVLHDMQDENNLEAPQIMRLCWFIIRMVRLPRALELREHWMKVLGLLCQRPSAIRETYSGESLDLAHKCLEYINLEDVGDFVLDDSRFARWADLFDMQTTVFDDHLVKHLDHGNAQYSLNNWRVRRLFERSMVIHPQGEIGTSRKVAVSNAPSDTADMSALESGQIEYSS